MMVVKKDNFKGIVSNLLEVDVNEYIEPLSKKVFKYDHVKQLVLSVKGADPRLFDHPVEPFRVAIEEKVMGYVNDYYLEDAAFATFTSRNENGTIDILISGSLFNDDNFWNGRWRSLWSINLTNESEVNIKGHIKITVHYFEEGNVQLNSNFQKSATIARNENVAQVAEDIVTTISNIEGEFHEELDNTYEKMSSTTFKALRRALPITRSLMDWNKLDTYTVMKN